MIGHLCLSLVHASLFVFLRSFVEMMQQWNSFGPEPLTKQLSNFKGKSLFHKYQPFAGMFFASIGQRDRWIFHSWNR